MLAGVEFQLLDFSYQVKRNERTGQTSRSVNGILVLPYGVLFIVAKMHAMKTQT